MFTVILKKKPVKSICKAPERIQEKFAILLEDLREYGPVQLEWQNYSKLGDDNYHCHLTRKWVACWRCEENSIIIEVYYAGSRENAPY